MVIYLGADHQGFKLKEYIKRVLGELGYSVADIGNSQCDEKDHYPYFAGLVAKKVSEAPESSRGIVICGSGVGMDIVANKFPNVRCALAMTPDQAFDSRNDDDVNMLALAAKHIEPDAAKKILITWLETPFSNEPQHLERIQSIFALEETLYKTPKSRSQENDFYA